MQEAQDGCVIGTYLNHKSYWVGCEYKIEKYFDENANLLIWAFGGLAVVKVF